MNDIRPVRLALIGLGMATRPHLAALGLPLDGVELSGVMSRSRATADAVAGPAGLRRYDGIGEICADASIDGVILATPPDQRLDLVEALARAGKPILMEKPVERTYAAARQLVEICDRAGVHLGIVLQHRFRPDMQRLRELLDASVLGEIVAVRVDLPWWRDQAYYDQPGRGSHDRDGGGVLITQAIHILDLMLSLVGPAESVQAFFATTRLHAMEAEDFVAAGIRFRSGAVGSVTATTAAFPGGAETIAIDGTLGSAKLCGGELVVTWHDGRRDTFCAPSGTGGGADPMAFPCDWHAALITDFADAVRRGRPPRVTGRDALHVHALIDAMTRSAREGRIVAVPPVG
ncbi:Gfo/Idh/MocA family protein [Hoeflea olei]|uniref:Dehydrogenase n=1 Tax=Hoeflea olei TaxID=1480615 RepID=A0A1C1YZ99_9HYPH|nr:Gfo/Idh/MocA family oxidoreductase [Hoeflea olei]OCW58736.1 dehydrogenase [Hoeflea olei]